MSYAVGEAACLERMGQSQSGQGGPPGGAPGEGQEKKKEEKKKYEPPPPPRTGRKKVKKGPEGMHRLSTGTIMLFGRSARSFAI